METLFSTLAAAPDVAGDASLTGHFVENKSASAPPALSSFDCPCSTGRNIAAGSGTKLSDLYGNGPGQLPPGGLLNTCLAVSGHLIIDEDYAIDGGEMLMQPGASITIEAEVELKVRNIDGGAIIQGCGQMWQGIVVKPRAVLRFEHNRIEDAQYAILAHRESSLIVTGNHFNRNFVGLYTPVAGGPQPVNLPEGPIGDNRFTCSSGLSPGYPGQSPSVSSGDIAFAGMEFNDAVVRVGSSAQPDAENGFEGLRNGIVARNSHIDIFSVDISDMDYGLHDFSAVGYDLEGVGIFLENCRAIVSRNLIHEVSIAARVLASDLYFEQNTLIDNIDGIHVFGGIGPHALRVSSNAIDFIHTGINLQNMSAAKELFVDDNEMVHVTASSFETNYPKLAIAVTGAGPFPGVAAGARYIVNNSISLSRNGCVGIALGSSHRFGLFDNTVSIGSQAQEGPGFGSFALQVLGSDENYLYGNSASAAGLVADQGVGLAVAGSVSNTLCCNSTDDIDLGLVFWGMCNGTRLRQTSIGTHHTGLRCQNGTVIGQQVHGGNRWLGSYSDFSAVHLGQSFEVAGSRFFVQLPMSPPLWPDSPYSPNNPGGWFNPLDGTAAASCAADAACPALPLILEELLPPLSENDFYAAEGAYGDSSAYGAYLTWEGARHLYRKLRRDSSLLGQEAVIDSFYQAADSSLLGVLYRLEQGILSLYLPDSALQALQTALDDHAAGMRALEGALAEASDSAGQAAILADIWDLQLLQADDWEAWLDLAASRAGQISLAAGGLIHENAGLDTAGIFAQNEKAVNEVLLSLAADGAYRLDSAQLAVIEPIAFQCPFEGGHAVYRARALYLLNERAAFNDVQLCQNSEDRPPSLPGAALSAEPAEDFLLFPNPTQGGWNLGVPESHVGQPLSIRIHDISGQLLGRREIRAAASIERIDSRLESGIYFIEAWHEGQRIFSGRLVVIQ